PPTRPGPARPRALHRRACPATGPPGRRPPRDGVVLTVAAFDVVDGRVTGIWVVRNPEKLRPWAR
ncbi:hypothetical protein ACFV8H_26845, partial [Kitasatospora sp. NPDC059827]